MIFNPLPFHFGFPAILFRTGNVGIAIPRLARLEMNTGASTGEPGISAHRFGGADRAQNGLGERVARGHA